MTTGSNTSAPRVKQWPLTPGFWMDYHGQVKAVLHELSREETAVAMQHYIHGASIGECVHRIRLERML